MGLALDVSGRLRELREPVDELQRTQRNALVLLAGAALTLLPHFGHLPLWISAGASALLLVRAGLTLWNKPAPPRWVLILLSILAAFGIYRSFGTLVGRDAGVASLVLLAGFKLLEMRARRDLFVVVFLCFFLLLTQFFYGQGLTVFILGLLSVLLLVVSLTLFHAGELPASVLRSSIKDAGKALLVAAPLAILAFVLFPRLSSPLWGLPLDANAGRTGLSETMAIGDVSTVAQSDEIVFRIKFLQGLPSQSQRYFRGPVLARFDGTTWRPLLDASRPEVAVRNIPVDAQRLDQDITLEPQSRPWLFALEQPVVLPTVNGDATRMTREGLMIAPTLSREKMRYSVTSVPMDAWQNIEQLPAGSRARQFYIDLPQGSNPRLLQWAADLRQKIGVSQSDPTPFIAAILKHLHEQPFRYTLEPPELPKLNPIDAFFFDTQAGFCEHYAQAFTVLMRALDFPARVVTGYQGGEVNPVDNRLTIRQLDAHAWVEVWVENRGWIRVDPTGAVAPERIDSGFSASFPTRSFSGTGASGAASWFGWVRSLADATGTSWNDWVVGFGSQRQREFFGKIGMPDMDWEQLLLYLLAAGVIGLGIIALLNRPRRTAASQAARWRKRLAKPFVATSQAPAENEDLRAWQRRIGSNLAAEEATALERAILAFEAQFYAPASATPPALGAAIRQLATARKA
jgi:transglutaminase-like putative cysteine protease